MLFLLSRLKYLSESLFDHSWTQCLSISSSLKCIGTHAFTFIACAQFWVLVMALDNPAKARCGGSGLGVGLSWVGCLLCIAWKPGLISISSGRCISCGRCTQIISEVGRWGREGQRSKVMLRDIESLIPHWDSCLKKEIKIKPSMNKVGKTMFKMIRFIERHKRTN